MAISADTLKSLIDEHSGAIREEIERLDRIRDYINGVHDKPYIPHNATDQYKKLVDRSVINLLPMVRNAPLHQLHIDGVWIGPKDGNQVPAWKFIWQPNRMDLISTQIISAALTDNYAYGLVVSGKTRGGRKTPAIKGVAARRMYALYEDPVADLWPQYAFDLNSNGEIVGIWDEEARYPVRIPEPVADSDGNLSYPPPELGVPELHGAEVCPVVRFVPNMDLDGNCYGEIESNIAVQDRINQVSFDLLKVQHYGAFQRSGFSGVEVAKDRYGNPIPVTVDPARTIVLPEGAKPWHIPGDALDGFILALQEAIHNLAVTSQTPAHYLLGKLANLSADAIAAAETTLTRKVFAYKHALGEPFEQLLRLASKMAGLDFPEDAEIQWADRESRSLSQVADAINKLVGVGVPQEALWEMIPNVTQSQIEDWKKLAKEQRVDVLDGLAEKLTQQPATGAEDAV